MAIDSRNKEKKEKSEFDQKLLSIARVVRVVAGGRRFSFRATMAVGDRKGRVGVGVAKGKDVSQAIEKAVARAKKALIKIKIVKGTIPFEISAKYGAAKVFMRPAGQGKGLVAGGALRIVCDLAGIENVTGKIIGRTTNQINNARATIEALKSFS